MKRLFWIVILIMLTGSGFCVNTPRVLVQKLVLEKGQLPLVTMGKNISAKEYILTADILENKGDVLSTQTHPMNTICIKKVGDGRKHPINVIAFVHLGNFQQQWISGQTLHLTLTHIASKKTISWDVYIPAGSQLINLMNQPQIIPGKAAK
jgi:hypothetical protein